MDFSKAFDKSDHHKLVHTLQHMGVYPNITTCIKDFLLSTSPVLSGVTLGSVVGLCLLTAYMYINDQPGSVRSRVRLFAVDTIVYLLNKPH